LGIQNWHLSSSLWGPKGDPRIILADEFYRLFHVILFYKFSSDKETKNTHFNQKDSFSNKWKEEILKTTK